MGARPAIKRGDTEAARVMAEARVWFEDCIRVHGKEFDEPS
jgi:hypothetical protein